MNIPILYEDNHLLVVEKPVNMPVQEDESGDLDLLSALKLDIKRRYNKPGNVYLGLVHRLDRPVGGVMVFAKTSKAASRLSDQLRRGVIDRKYLAISRGVPKKRQDNLRHYLYKDRKKNQVFSVKKSHPEAKMASLDYRLLGTASNNSLLSVRLHTGRSHQIRVQLATEGFPLYGDQKYGKNVNKPGEQIALWAHTLQFEHPTSKEIVRFVSEPPRLYPWELWKDLDETFQTYG
ncbi:RluA family pseudouridine synthase [Sporosarcina sp. PTS2304]|uniref:RluA family pseudouridine synthase n=1 Tax=Sporosarcina sp. PTS2304 TaxID=2283194 RepID=UPI000E0D54EB|nr:RluA family pseudouridine synthase [Sporosarcina sp. PTS2304]AXH99955.1 RluA family pseudouridine synthase [Sporosarcina sp. PTS2304]